MTAVDDTALNEVFHGQEDGFHGITVESCKEKCDIIVFIRNGKVIFSGDISFSEPYVLFRVVLNTDYTVIVPG